MASDNLSSKWEEVEEGHKLLVFYQRYWGPQPSGPSLPFPTESFTVAGSATPIPSPDGLFIIDDQPIHLSTIWIGHEFNAEINGRLLVRREYELIYEWVQTDSLQPRYRGVIVTGQPGIGKSFFLYYCLARRLWEHKDTVFVSGKSIFLLSHHGVHLLTPLSLEVPSVAGGTWALVDSDPGGSIPPENITITSSRLYIVHATPPEPDRYKSWKKQRGARMLYMNPFTWEEVWSALELQTNFTSDDRTIDLARRLYRLFATYGPSARDIYRMVLDEGEEAQYRDDIKKIVCSLDARVLREVLTSDNNTALEHEKSHKIILLTRQSLPPRHQDHTRTFVSNVVKDMVIAQFSNAKDEEIAWVFHTFAGIPELATSTGNLFETYCHRKFVQRSTHFPMIEMSSDPKEDFLYFTLASASFTPTRRLLPSTGEDRERVNFRLDENLGKLDPLKYYVPASLTNAGYDAFLVDSNEALYALQLTVQKVDEAKDQGLKDLLVRSGGKPVNFVAVIPQGYSVQLRVRKGWESQMKFYSITVDVTRGRFPWLLHL